MRYGLMNLVCFGVLLLGGTQALAQTPPTAAKKIYCWDEGGKRVCGDALPSSAVNSARTEFNPQTGLPSKIIPRALTPEEQAVADAAAQEAVLAAKRQEDRGRLGQALIASYADEAALAQSFVERKQRSQQSLRSAQAGLVALRKVQLMRLTMAGEKELNKQPITPKDQEKIIKGHKQISTQLAAVKQQEDLLLALETERAESIQVYREARGHINGTSTTAPGPVAVPTPPGK